MRVPLLIGAAVMCVAVLLMSRPLRANAAVAHADDAAAQRRAGALVWEMSEKHHEWRDRRIARKMTPDKVQKLTESTAGTLAKRRDALAKLLPALTPDTKLAKDLSRFLQRWPDRQAFLDDLQAASAGEASGKDITSLAMQLTDTRRGWKTLFPFFRP